MHVYALGVSPTHDASEIIICNIFMKGPRTTPSWTPLFVGRGYLQYMGVSQNRVSPK